VPRAALLLLAHWRLNTLCLRLPQPPPHPRISQYRSGHQGATAGAVSSEHTAAPSSICRWAGADLERATAARGGSAGSGTASSGELDPTALCLRHLSASHTLSAHAGSSQPTRFSQPNPHRRTACWPRWSQSCSGGAARASGWGQRTQRHWQTGS